MKLKKLVRAHLRKKMLPFQPALTFNDVLIKPKISDINSRSELQDLGTPIARNFSLRIPITSANMDTVTGSRMAIAIARLGGLGFIPQFDSIENRLKEVMCVKQGDDATPDVGRSKRALRDKEGRLAVGATLWLKGNYLNEAEEFLNAGADVLLVDTARGGAKLVFEATREVRRRFPEAIVISGNVATPEEVEYLARAGADCIKVGIGPGSACSTREETGVGVPQVYAVTTCVAVAKHYGVQIIADGSIEKGGHLAKALGAGASAVMIGGLFSGTEESPGRIWFDKKRQTFVKRFFGSASQEQQELRMQKGNLDAMRHAEGESGDVVYIGSVNEVVWKLCGGLRSSMSYVGARNLKEFEEKVEFIWQTSAGYEEGRPRI